MKTFSFSKAVKIFLIGIFPMLLSGCFLPLLSVAANGVGFNHRCSNNEEKYIKKEISAEMYRLQYVDSNCSFFNYKDLSVSEHSKISKK